MTADALTTRTVQILLALAEGPLHGYGIRQAIETRTGGQVVLRSGTLYEAVHRLVDQGWIAEVAAPRGEPASGGPARRFYALTTAGRRALASELARMEALVRFARRRDLVRER
jgi:DNA-binding PadR family transcriptional regulator